MGYLAFGLCNNGGVYFDFNIAGVLLAYAFLMIPAAIAAMFTKKWAGAVVIGWTVGFMACLIGLCSSYFFNLPYGPSLVLSLGIFFIAAIIIRCLFSNNKLVLMKGAE